MKSEKLYQQVKQKKAAQLYDRAAKLIEARRDFLYLANGDTLEIRAKHEKANQTANSLTSAYSLLEITQSLHLTVEQHMQLDPDICRFALDAIVSGIEEFKIRKSWMLN